VGEEAMLISVHMPEGAAQPIAVYHVEPEHFGSRALRAFRLAIDFAIFFTVLFIAELAHNYYDKLTGFARLSPFHTNRQIALAAAAWALLCAAWSYRNLRARRYKLEVQDTQITQTSEGKTVSFFPGNFGKVSEERGPLSVPGLLVRGYHADLFIPRGMPRYEKAKQQIFTALQVRR
jgi:hypothetical protein